MSAITLPMYVIIGIVAYVVMKNNREIEKTKSLETHNTAMQSVYYKIVFSVFMVSLFSMLISFVIMITYALGEEKRQYLLDMGGLITNVAQFIFDTFSREGVVALNMIVLAIMMGSMMLANIKRAEIAKNSR